MMKQLTYHIRLNRMTFRVSPIVVAQSGITSWNLSALLKTLVVSERNPVLNELAKGCIPDFDNSFRKQNSCFGKFV